MTQHIARLFDDIAPTYDFLNQLFSMNIDRHWRKVALRAVSFPPDAVILDCCTGTADIAIAVAIHHNGNHIYGIDLSENMLAMAKQKIARKRLERRIHLLKADALQLPFSEESVDVIFLSFGLRNLLNREQGIEEMGRVLKEHGHIVILEFPPPPSSLFGFIYRFYLGTIIPFIGGIISKSVSAYQYLHTSIEQFLQPEEIMKLLREHGFHVISTRCLMYGIVCLYIAQRETMNNKNFIKE